ncbi:SET domain-containing protein [Christiangramia aquimixticola]|uniref:SET domain-containing protein n=1 Tax=Christiangramia aquimixticola TaxID=1697558 RepID=UPI003AA8CC1C
MMHPHTRLEWINDKKGFGVIATQMIPKGTITWVQDQLDIVFLQKDADELNPITREAFEKYSFRNSAGEYILCWDLAKYVNHSFKSNCLSTAYNFEIAVRDIQIGEELTDDYGYLNISEEFIPEDEGVERKAVQPDDILKCYKEWDLDLERVFPLILDIAQPLYQLLSESVQQEIRKITSGDKKMLSTKNLYFMPEKSRI